MPHGFKCDRCKDFIEQDLRGFECHSDLRGDSSEIVRVANPFSQSDSGPRGGDVETFTLCKDCRMALVGDFVGRAD